MGLFPEPGPQRDVLQRPNGRESEAAKPWHQSPAPFALEPPGGRNWTIWSIEATDLR